MSWRSSTTGVTSTPCPTKSHYITFTLHTGHSNRQIATVDGQFLQEIKLCGALRQCWNCRQLSFGCSLMDNVNLQVIFNLRIDLTSCKSFQQHICRNRRYSLGQAGSRWGCSASMSTTIIKSCLHRYTYCSYHNPTSSHSMVSIIVNKHI